jgi:hypothetical protein
MAKHKTKFKQNLVRLTQRGLIEGADLLQGYDDLEERQSRKFQRLLRRKHKQEEDERRAS